MNEKTQQSNDLAVEFLRKAFDAKKDGQLEEAICLLKKAARLGSNAARDKLGTIYDDVVTPSQPDRAVYWYKQGVENGYSASAWNLAMHYAGLGRRRDYLYWLRIANEMGDEDAPNELRTEELWLKETDDLVVECLRKAFDAEEDGQLEEAIRLLKKAASLGSNSAKDILGTTYDDVVKPPQPDRAVYWYKQGVKNGYSDCAWNLAMHYAGLGRRRGYLYWLRIANEMGDEDAPDELRTEEWWLKRTKDLTRK